MTRRPRHLVLLLGLALSVTGCTPRMKPLTFNNTIAVNLVKLAVAGGAFRVALAKPAELQSSYQGMEKALKDAETEADKMKPPRPECAAEVLDKYKAFLAVERSLLDKQIKQLLDKARSGTLDPAERQKLFNEIDKEEDDALGKLKKAQEAYVKQYNLRLVN
jgi:hypothetical protein